MLGLGEQASPIFKGVMEIQISMHLAREQQSFSMMRLHQAELTILIRGSKEGEIRQNNNLVQNFARKRNHNKEPSQRGFDGGYEITSR
jgi:hypothetical protein